MLRACMVGRAAAAAAAGDFEHSQLTQRLSARPIPGRGDAGALADHFGLGRDSIGAWRAAVRKFNSPGAADSPKGALRRHISSLPRGPAVSDFIAYCVRDLGLVVSPFVKLQDTPHGISFVANRRIQRGQFLLSLPKDSAMVADLPSQQVLDEVAESRGLSEAERGALRDQFEMAAAVEDLSAQLLESLVSSSPEDDIHHTYAAFLREHVPPPKNAPFLTESDVTHPEPRRFLHAVSNMLDSPLCPALQGIDKANLRWAVSHVLSRRIGQTMMCPGVDLLNHADIPNAHTTAPFGTDEMSHADVLDNLMAGVCEDDLQHPHLHVTAVTELVKGEPVTLMYCSADSKGDPGFGGMVRLQWGFEPDMALEGPPLRRMDQLVGLVARERAANRGLLFPSSSSTAPEEGVMSGATPS